MRERRTTFVRSVVLLACGMSIPLARAASDMEKLAAVQKGLAYLYNTQQPGGSWNVPGFENAATAAGAFAILSQQDKWGSNSAPYQAAADKAIAYLISTANIAEVNARQDGVNICPGKSASCKGVYWRDSTGSVEATGFAAPAVAAYALRVGSNGVATTRGPLARMTWAEIVQGITNALAASQSTLGSGTKEGGWRALPGNGDSDSSDTQWAVLALVYDEALGAITPQVVKDELKIWLGNVQDASGAACLQPGAEPCDHANTGGWLLAMRFVGYDLTQSSVQSALAFLNTHWQLTANNLSYGNFGNPDAMWAVFAGLQTTIGFSDTKYVTNLLTNCGASPGNTSANRGVSCTWSEDYAEWLVKNQKADGSWSGYSSWSDTVATALYLDILAGTQIPLLPQSATRGGAAGDSISQGAIGQPLVSIPIAPLTPLQAVLPGRGPAKVRPFERKGVTAYAATVDGSTVASASTDNRIRLWDGVSGQQRLVLEGSPGLPTGLVFNANGRGLSSVGRDSYLHIWDAGTGAELARLSGHEHAIRAIAASPDGRILATAGEETRVMLWDLTNRSLLRILFGPTDFVNAISFSPNGATLAIAGEDARVLIFDVASGKLVYTLLGHAGPIDAVAFSPDGTLLASGGQDTVIHLWDPIRGVQRQVLTGHSAPIRTITFSPDGQQIASGGEDTRIILWNTATGTINKTLLGTAGFINVLSYFNPSGVLLDSASEAGDITLWNVITGEKVRTILVP